ncbi:alanine/glycine:cation symporter family protein [Ignatzschineria cameli]|uniref:Sodium:alanine symporter family protein n=1 Tax=Ignatzschineria cameli TaxID=2182793 RepID=A0A2U2ASC1_9GAMM|nr:alanine/glycine:cation symporter family protein [Ignatzschineria cameli]PWD86486.1 sodium:alanine symporter family protein [Ignatzschineria cameli]PWD87160.1 sodium:alanine symporter family protein [Ignatzschineria cameli]PWD92133.1 sodium:alanine symporter family protein [Ignatzschineria cameli]PWD93282.1 sodium:alanine symporter family protein [Ignatzschineria cameli]PWD94024.1 sodium:alanine symporter family protein [Ignatzschineria cameli]
MSFINWLIGPLNDFIWSYVLVAFLLILGIYFTLKTRFIQIRLFKEMFRLTVERNPGNNGVSAFQAFTISAASRVGTGNIAGVALAIAIGGPGAVFWMWIIALIGMSTAFIESTLAQVYKVKDGDNFRGGPAYYMKKALGWEKLGIIFAILLTVTFGFIFNSVQSNTIAQSFSAVFGIDTMAIGALLVIATGIIIFGGIRRVVHFTQLCVPIMALFYVGIALYVVITNISQVPEMFMLIINSAFGLKEFAGGGLGIAIMQGARRGLFSNEAGMGSVPNAAATANVSHPAKQGLVQSLGVFFDTIVVCSATAFIILLSGLYIGDNGGNGVVLTQNSLAQQVGDWAQYFVAIAILFFAFSSIIGNYYYGETNIEFIKNSSTTLLFYRLLVLVMVMFGAVMSMDIVWSLADLFMGAMTIINLIVISILGKVAFQVANDYYRQLKEKKNPTFRAEDIPGLKGAECWEPPIEERK